MTGVGPDYLREQAARCVCLASHTTGDVTATALLHLAAEYRRKAQEIELVNSEKGFIAAAEPQT
jgi:hypothetical protein